MKNIVSFIIIITVTSCAIAQNFETSKLNGNQPVSNQSLIYALPQTSISVTIEVTKTTIKKGPYAEYAEKYLKLTDVPLKDSQTFAVSNIKLHTQTEADPSQYFSITFKTFPDKLQHLFTVSRNGVILDFANAWRQVATKNLTDGAISDPLIDPNLLEETSKEKVDTLYKTVMTDSTFVRIPVFKKQIQAKTQEEIIEETANQLLKTRRHKIKILRGEYDYHPDGPALKVMIEELSKYEETLLSLFIGTKTIEKQHYTFIVVPQANSLSKDLCYFDQNKGILTEPTPGISSISIRLTQEQEPAKGIVPDRTKNTLYVRTPIMAGVNIKLDDKSIYTTRIPVYQFGPVMVMPMN
jgi:hypothetical protein